MNAARDLLGSYTPGRTPWHRLGAGPKYLVFVLLTLPAVIWPHPAVVGGLLAFTLALVASTGAPLRRAWGLPRALVVLLGALGAWHVFTGAPALAVRVLGVALIALYASRIVLITTPMPVLVDALVAAARPLHPLGLDPERFALAVAIFLRSVPHVAASFGSVRDAARARGLERNPFALITPVVVQAVAYARATGDALVARGLGEPDPEP